MEISVDKEMVNQIVAKAILDSAIGEIVKESVKKTLDKWDMQQAMEQAIKDIVFKYAREYTLKTYSEQIAAKAKELIDAKLSGDFIEKKVEEIWSHIQRGY